MADSTDTTEPTPTVEFDAQAAIAALSAQFEKFVGVVDKRITGLHAKVTVGPKEPAATPAPKTEAPSSGLSAQAVDEMISAALEADRIARDLPEEAQATLAELKTEGATPKMLALMAKLLKSKQAASPAVNGAQAPKPGKAHAPPAPGSTPHPKTLREYQTILLGKDDASKRRAQQLLDDPSFDPETLR